MILYKDIQINASQCDASAVLSLIGALQISEDLLTELFGILHIDGVTIRNKYQGLVVYTKNKVKFYHNLHWGMKMKSETFISRISPIRMYVDTLLKDEDGNLFYHSKVECCVISMVSMTPMRLSSCGIEKSYAESDEIPELTYDLINTEGCEQCDERRVRTSNIDYIHHTNNIEYMRFIVDTYPVSYICENFFDEVQIDYVSQSHENDLLQIMKKKESECKDVCTILLDGKATINCAITFRKEK